MTSSSDNPIGPRPAFLFPGQGSQKVGIGKDLYNNYPAARRVFEEVDEALGEPLSKLIFEGPQKELDRTWNCQPAIMTVRLATGTRVF